MIELRAFLCFHEDAPDTGTFVIGIDHDHARQRYMRILRRQRMFDHPRLAELHYFRTRAVLAQNWDDDTVVDWLASLPTVCRADGVALESIDGSMHENEVA